MRSKAKIIHKAVMDINKKYRMRHLKLLSEKYRDLFKVFRKNHIPSSQKKGKGYERTSEWIMACELMKGFHTSDCMWASLMFDWDKQK
jgi:hypothetical protein